MKKPSWLKTPWVKPEILKMTEHLRGQKLHTVCEEALCPNLGECWAEKTATYMLLGDTCTRACKFCHIKTGKPLPPDPKEPLHIAQSCLALQLDYVVITMVDRDDLEDGGSLHIAKTIQEIKKVIPPIKIELLLGDFGGHFEYLHPIWKAQPHVLAHNVETVARLSPRVRDARASYERSLKILKTFKDSPFPLFTKSSLMLGLGESSHEIEETLEDLRNHNVDLLTLGQYLQPTAKHLKVKEWISPEDFALWKEKALSMGFLNVVSGPLIRSSYKAKAAYEKAMDFQNPALFQDD